MFEKGDLCFKIAMVVEMLEKLVGYRVELEKDGSRSCVEKTVTHPARRDAWTGRVVKTTDTEVERGGRGQTLLSPL